MGAASPTWKMPSAHRLGTDVEGDRDGTGEGVLRGRQRDLPRTSRRLRTGSVARHGRAYFAIAAVTFALVANF